MLHCHAQLLALVALVLVSLCTGGGEMSIKGRGRFDGHKSHVPMHRAQMGADKVRAMVMRELGEYSDVYGPYGRWHGGGMSVEELAGEEIVGARLDSTEDEFLGPDLNEGTVFVGNITVDGKEVPVTAYEQKGAYRNVSVVFIGDIVVGNLTQARTLVRRLTCAKIAAVANDAAYDQDAEIAVCAFVEQNCGPHRGLFNYMAWIYCGRVRSYPYIGALLILVWVVVLLIWLATQVEFLIPALHTCSDVFGMRQSVAGVTFLAFGNGCADLFGMIAATLSGPTGLELAVGEVLGNGMFVFCAVQGAVALLSPFKVDGAEYIRDVSVYAVSIILTVLVLADGHVHWYEAAGMIALYVAYMFLVIRFDEIRPSLGLGERDGRADIGDVHEEEKKSAKGRAAMYKRIMEASPCGTSPARALWLHLFPFEQDEPFKTMSWFELCIALIRAPVVFMMKLTTPVVDQSLPRNGWVRPAMAVQVFFVPLLVLAFILMQEGIPDRAYDWDVFSLLFGIAVVLGALASTWLWSDTAECDARDSPPTYHKYLGVLGFIIALVWIFAIAREIVNAILAFGVVYEVGTLVLGVTILAIGIGMQDLVTCVGIARAGLPAMAASSCVGSSSMNILLGMGLAGLVSASMLVESELYISLQLLLCIVFMLLSVVVAIVFMLYDGFNANALFGFTLIGIYVVFVACSLLVGSFGDVMLREARAALAVSWS